ncbi:MAG: hypothetical protein AAGC97_07660 [Planctomycetota bacterium]
MTISPCPPESSLVLWNEGLLSEDIADEIAAHIDECPACEKRLTLVALVRQSSVGQTGFHSERECDNLVKSLTQTLPAPISFE